MPEKIVDRFIDDMEKAADCDSFKLTLAPGNYSLEYSKVKDSDTNKSTK